MLECLEKQTKLTLVFSSTISYSLSTGERQ